MCLCRRRSIRDCDPKTRRIWSCGQLSLSTGIALTLFATSFEQRHHDLFDAMRGFFIGLAIVCLVWSARRMKCASNRTY